MKLELYGTKRNAIVFSAGYDDFKSTGDEQAKVRAWQEAYFSLLTWKDTWGLAYRLDIVGKRKEYGYFEPNVVLTVNVGQKERVLDYLEDLGYGGINAYETEVFEAEEGEADGKDLFCEEVYIEF